MVKGEKEAAGRTDFKWSNLHKKNLRFNADFFYYQFYQLSGCAPYTEYFQQPYNNRNNHNYIQDRFNWSGHRDKTVYKPEKKSHHDQRDYDCN